MTRLLPFAAVLLGACKCSGALGPLIETPPSNLGEAGIVIDQPDDGAASGAWTTVSGWFDPAAVTGVLITGAPGEGFYLPTGHVGAPTVPVLARTDGRFFAPRVPLQDGETRVVVVPLGRTGADFEPLTRTLQVTDSAVVPATLVIEPTQPEPGQPARLRAATSADSNLNWQWDFEGDGTFDLEGKRVEHAWPGAGRFQVTARTRINGRWVSAYSRVTVGSSPSITKKVSGPGEPQRLFALPRQLAPGAAAATGADGELDRRTQYLVVLDARSAQVFDGDLNPLFTIDGLSRPSFVAGDPAGNLYITDTGNDRILRYAPSGALDLGFATQGEFKGSSDLPLKRPVALALGPKAFTALVEDGAAEVSCTNPTRLPNGAYEGLGNWSNLRCGRTPLDHLSLSSEARALPRPSIAFANGPTTGVVDRFLSKGALLDSDGNRLAVVGGATAVALGPAQDEDEMVWLDAAGALHHQKGNENLATWTFSTPLSAVASGADGAVYVAAPGSVELLAGPRLR